MTNTEDDLIPNPYPGILLKEDFLDEMGITPYRLSQATGVMVMLLNSEGLAAD